MHRELTRLFCGEVWSNQSIYIYSKASLSHVPPNSERLSYVYNSILHSGGKTNTILAPLSFKPGASKFCQQYRNFFITNHTHFLYTNFAFHTSSSSQSVEALPNRPDARIPSDECEESGAGVAKCAFMIHTRRREGERLTRNNRQ